MPSEYGSNEIRVIARSISRRSGGAPRTAGLALRAIGAGRQALAATVAAAALTLGACGDDDAGGATVAAPAAGHATATGSEEHGTGGLKAAPGSVEAVVAQVLADHYAMPTCAELTANAERQFGYGPGPDCDEVIADHNTPKDVVVTDVRVDGATATAVASGSTFKLVRKGGSWLIDGTQ